MFWLRNKKIDVLVNILTKVLVLFLFCNHLDEEEGAGCFTLNSVLAVVWLSVSCVSSMLCHGLVCGR